MASIDQNRDRWEHAYAWSSDGDEWSSGWGGPERQWSRWVEPRIAAATGRARFGHGTVVEIGCGRGRWTQFLAESFDEVTGVDLAPSCVAHCRSRFADQENVRVLEGDGSSLDGVPDGSVDLVVSIDSLVHADVAALAGYVAECSRVLRADGVALLHHSNLASCGPERWALLEHRRVRRALSRLRIVERSVHWRDRSVDAGVVSRLAEQHRLVCVRQELIRWDTRRHYIDCISTLRRAGGEPFGPMITVHNDGFLDEMKASADAPS